MTRRTKEWIIPVGKDGEGNVEYRVIGYELEDDFGNGNKTTRLEVCLDVLSPVLYQQVKGMNEPKTSSVGIAVRRDFAKRYKAANQAPAQAQAPEAAGEGEGAAPLPALGTDGQ